MVEVFGEQHSKDLALKCEIFLNETLKDVTATVIIHHKSEDIPDTGGTYGDTNLVEVEYTSLLSLAHELVHVTQILSGRLNLNTYEWDGVVQTTDAYWEDDAYNLESEVLETWLI